MIFVQNKAIGVKIIIKRLCVACCNLNIMCFGSVGFFELFLNYCIFCISFLHQDFLIIIRHKKIKIRAKLSV